METRLAVEVYGPPLYEPNGGRGAARRVWRPGEREMVQRERSRRQYEKRRAAGARAREAAAAERNAARLAQRRAALRTRLEESHMLLCAILEEAGRPVPTLEEFVEAHLRAEERARQEREQQKRASS